MIPAAVLDLDALYAHLGPDRLHDLLTALLPTPTACELTYPSATDPDGTETFDLYAQAQSVSGATVSLLVGDAPDCARYDLDALLITRGRPSRTTLTIR